MSDDKNLFGQSTGMDAHSQTTYGSSYRGPQQKRNNNTWLYLLGLLAAASIGLNLWQWSSLKSAKTNLSETTTKLSEETTLRQETERLFNEANLQLEELKSSNTTLNGQIAQYQKELEEKKNRIAILLKDSKNYQLVRDELARTKTEYESRIASLTAELERLTADNTKLKSNVAALETSLSAEKSAKETVIAEKAAVVAEKTQLQEEKTVLTKKVDIASAIKVNNVFVTGLNVKGSGKEVESSSASKVDRLKICFSATQNDVVSGGREQFHIRILNPTGETMQVESQGGGVIRNDRGEQIPYSIIKEADYNNSSVNYCTIYEPGMALKKGNYEVEVYNKGFKVGRGTFTLK